MIKVNCLNPIAKVGMNLLPETFGTTDNFAEADAVLVRSAALHDLQFDKGDFCNEKIYNCLCDYTYGNGHTYRKCYLLMNIMRNILKKYIKKKWNYATLWNRGSFR